MKGLLNYVRSGRMHPGLIFTGPDRDAKLAAARKLAAALLCAKPTTEGGCGRCNACRRIAADGHPDVVVFREAEEDVIKIDSVRHLARQMELGPIEGAMKIAIIDEAHRMNASAANAFLKTLEEPGPGRFFWLLTTQVGALLETTRSRCVELAFKPEGPVGLTAAQADEYRALFDAARVAGNVAPLVAAIEKDRERCLGFLQFLQGELRESALKGDVASLRRFDEVVSAEGRLRSHANHGLMIETLLRREFLP